jgi:hypothetical protein
MGHEGDDVIKQIKSFTPDVNGWRGLDALLDELFQSPSPERGIAAMLGVLERYPNQDGAGVLWSIVHGLEHLSGYESFLIESLRRQPTDLTLTMVNRLLNVGIASVDGVDLAALLAEIEQHPRSSEDIRAQAREVRLRHTT